jgi:hypothetical protein
VSTESREDHIHKAKPWHGLREFLKEYAIIVARLPPPVASQANLRL